MAWLNINQIRQDWLINLALYLYIDYSSKAWWRFAINTVLEPIKERCQRSKKDFIMKHVHRVQEYMPMYTQKLLSDTNTDNTEQLVRTAYIFYLVRWAIFIKYLFFQVFLRDFQNTCKFSRGLGCKANTSRRRSFWHYFTHCIFQEKQNVYKTHTNRSKICFL